MLSGETQKQTRERNVETILSAAEKVFAEAGYKGASISMIAKEAGVAKSNVAYYFHSKEELYKQVIEDILNLWLDASAGMDEEDDPETSLRSYIHDKMELSRLRPHGSKVWANEIIHGAPFVQDFLEGRLKEWTTSREKILSRWMEKGQIKRVNPKAILYMIWSSTQHYADFMHQIKALNNDRDMTEKDWKQAKKNVSDIILGGLGL